LHRSDGATAQSRRVLIRKAGCTHQDQRFPMVGSETVQRGPKVEELHVSFLCRACRQTCRVTAFLVTHLMPAFAKLRIILVTENCIKPGVHVRPRLESAD